MKWLLLLTSIIVSINAYGVAFCALRDPVQKKQNVVSELCRLRIRR